MRPSISTSYWARMKMRLTKERDVVKFKCLEDENAFMYDVLRRQAGLLLESIQTSGPMPMDISTLQSADLSTMTEEKLADALLVLRKGEGKGKRGPRRHRRQRQGQGRQEQEEDTRQLLDLGSS